jgi:hypothetical protein
MPFITMFRLLAFVVLIFIMPVVFNVLAPSRVWREKRDALYFCSLRIAKFIAVIVRYLFSSLYRQTYP